MTLKNGCHNQPIIKNSFSGHAQQEKGGGEHPEEQDQARGAGPGPGPRNCHQVLGPHEEVLRQPHDHLRHPAPLPRLVLDDYETFFWSTQLISNKSEFRLHRTMISDPLRIIPLSTLACFTLAAPARFTF